MTTARPPLAATGPPQLLSPAGDLDLRRAAVENGADAIYFGLRTGLNARAKAANFALEDLPELMAYLHLRGVRGLVALNTLVFPSELELLEGTVRAVVSAGVDAAIVQDFGAARLIRCVAPDFPLHASTQMSITSAEGVTVARRLGICRVVLARELSLDELRRIRAETDLELEVFVHGALCISYSGQCSASLGMGGRSANRGQCAQQCRLPYQLVCDGQVRELKDRKYLVSPLDLAALDLVPELLAAGVDALKIEGRMKSPQYVAAATRQYRTAIDEALAGRGVRWSPEQVAELEGPFSRGFSHGWLDGKNPHVVEGRHSANRGLCIGKVAAVRGAGWRWSLRPRRAAATASPSPPAWAKSTNRAAASTRFSTAGGRSKRLPAARWNWPSPATGPSSTVCSRARNFGRPTTRSSIAACERRLPRGRACRRVPLDIAVEAAVGRRLCLVAHSGTGKTCRIESPQELEAARRHPLTVEVLREQFGRLGTSVYELRELEARIEGSPMAPLSVLGQMRHAMIGRLDAAAVAVPPPRLLEGRPHLPAEDSAEGCKLQAPMWHVLCRELQQVEKVLALGATSIFGDFADSSRCGRAVQMARRQGAEIFLATPRIQKPGEESHFARLADASPDGLLVRNLGGAGLLRRASDSFCGRHVAGRGQRVDRGLAAGTSRRRVAAAYDCDPRRLVELADSAPGRSWKWSFTSICLCSTRSIASSTPSSARAATKRARRSRPKKRTARPSGERRRAVSPA